MNKNKDCPEGKEINAITGRCVKKCKDGEKRYLKTGKCMKIKLNKKFNKSLKLLNNKIITKLELPPINNSVSIFIGSPISQNQYSLHL